MTDLARNGSVLVAEIKAIHPPAQGGSNGDAAVHINGVIPTDDATYTNGVANGSQIHPKGSVLGTASDGGVAPAIDPSVTTPPTLSQLSNGHAHEASGLNAGTGAIAVPNHSTDPSLATGVPQTEAANVPHTHDAAAVPAAAAAGGSAAAGAALPGLIQPQTTPIQPIQPSQDAREVHSQVNTTLPAGDAVAPTSAEPATALSAGTASGTAPGSVISAQQQQPQQLNAAAPAAAGAVGAAGVAAAGAPIVAHPAPTTMAANEAPKSALSAKEAKKVEKLMKTEAKNEQKSIKRAIKDAGSSEKLFRKSRDAETQAMKKHQKAQSNEQEAAKALSKAKAEHEKYAADLAKAVEDLDIKKRHTLSTREGYEKAKKHIDELRNQKTVNDQARSRQAAQLHGAA